MGPVAAGLVVSVVLPLGVAVLAGPMSAGREAARAAQVAQVALVDLDRRQIR